MGLGYSICQKDNLKKKFPSNLRASTTAIEWQESIGSSKMNPSRDSHNCSYLPRDGNIFPLGPRNLSLAIT